MSNWVWVTGAKIIRDNFQFRELSFPALEANDPKLSPAILWNNTNVSQNSPGDDLYISPAAR